MKVNFRSQNGFGFFADIVAPNLVLKLITAKYANMVSCGYRRITFVIKSNSVRDRQHASGARI